MSISLSKLPWYGQLAVFVLIGVGAIGAFWNWYAKPAQADIDTRQAQLAAIRVEINRASTTARRLPEFRKEVATLEAQLERLRTVLPEQRDVAGLLNRIDAMARQSNLKVLGFIPKDSTKKALHVEWPIGLRLEGSYHDLGTFMARISRFPRIVNVGDIKIRARDQQTSRSTVTAEVIATTFVLADHPKPAAPAPGGV